MALTLTKLKYKCFCGPEPKPTRVSVSIKTNKRMNALSELIIVHFGQCRCRGARQKNFLCLTNLAPFAPFALYVISSLFFYLLGMVKEKNPS